jgi:ankyrin repeat protein
MPLFITPQIPLPPPGEANVRGAGTAAFDVYAALCSYLEDIERALGGAQAVYARILADVNANSVAEPTRYLSKGDQEEQKAYASRCKELENKIKDLQEFIDGYRAQFPAAKEPIRECLALVQVVALEEETLLARWAAEWAKPDRQAKDLVSFASQKLHELKVVEGQGEITPEALFFICRRLDPNHQPLAYEQPPLNLAAEKHKRDMHLLTQRIHMRLKEFAEKSARPGVNMVAMISNYFQQRYGNTAAIQTLVERCVSAAKAYQLNPAHPGDGVVHEATEAWIAFSTTAASTDEHPLVKRRIVTKASARHYSYVLLDTLCRYNTTAIENSMRWMFRFARDTQLEEHLANVSDAYLPELLAKYDGNFINAMIDHPHWWGNYDHCVVATRIVEKLHDKYWNATTEVGRTGYHGKEYFQDLLKRAVRSLNRPFAQALVDAKVNVNARRGDGSTLLLDAAKAKSAERVRILLDLGASYDMGGPLINSPIHYAYISHSTEILQMLLKLYPNVQALMKAELWDTEINRKFCTSGSQALFDYACSLIAADQLATLDKLITAGFDVNLTGERHTSLLHYAAGKGKIRAAKLLLSHGTSVMVKDTKGQMPIYTAIQQAGKSSLEMVQFLVTQGALLPPDGPDLSRLAHFAATNSNLKCMLFFIEKGAEIDSVLRIVIKKLALSERNTLAIALLDVYAARVNDVSTTRHFVNAAMRVQLAGIPINDHLKATIIKHAKEFLRKCPSNNNLTTASLLIDLVAANEYTKTSDLNALIKKTVTGGRTITLLFLLGQGIDKNAPDIYGRTPLHLTALSGHVSSVELLLQRGAKVHAMDYAGRTPLDLVLDSPKSNPSAKVVNMLLDAYKRRATTPEGREAFVAAVDKVQSAARVIGIAEPVTQAAAKIVALYGDRRETRRSFAENLSKLRQNIAALTIGAS